MRQYRNETARACRIALKITGTYRNSRLPIKSIATTTILHISERVALDCEAKSPHVHFATAPPADSITTGVTSTMPSGAHLAVLPPKRQDDGMEKNVK